MRKFFLLSISLLLVKAGGFAGSNTSTDAMKSRGSARFMQGNYQAATEDFTRYLDAKPQSAQAYMYRGLAYIAMGNEQSGREDINKAIRINPRLAHTVKELSPKAASAPKSGKLVQITTKKGVPLRTKKGPVVYRAK